MSKLATKKKTVTDILFMYDTVSVEWLLQFDHGWSL